ncbi:MAG: sodium-dependent transporter [Defluviitaleaceae bacterium]|nr:sodium-dependent transporter [Defluviitaleaceae bacterium]
MFILAAVGSAVGLGNIWRYPFTAFDNGAGAFLIPYFIALLTAGIPILLLEHIVGSRYGGAAPVAYARASKKWEFLGWLPTMVAAMIIYYYIVILAWALNFVGFAATRAWGDDPSAFFFGEFLQVPANPFEFGGLNIPVTIALLFIWILTYVACSRNIKKGLEVVNKFLLPVMFVSMVVLMIYGAALPGAGVGLTALFTPNFDRILDPNIWVAAYGQVFFSVSACMGIMVTYGSYLPKKTEMVNTAFTIGFADSLMSMISATAIFGILGYMAVAQGVAVGDVAAGGAGLVFAVIPVALNLMGDVGLIFGTFFFVCLFITGWTSFISLMEAFVAPFVVKFNAPRRKVYAVLCVSGFSISLVYATDSGLLILGIVSFVLDYGLALGGFLQAIAAAYIIKNLPELKAYANEHAIIKLGNWYDVCIKYIFPGIVIVMTGFWINAVVGGRVGAVNYPPDVLLVFHGGSIAIMLAAIIYFTRTPWKTPIFDQKN